LGVVIWIGLSNWFAFSQTCSHQQFAHKNRIMQSIIALFLALIALQLPQQADACSCYMRNPDAPLYERYPGDLFFRSTVIKQLTFPSGNGITQMFDMTPLKYLVEIVRVFKGCSIKVSDRIVITTMKDSSLCGVNLSVNSSYILSSGLGTPIDAGTKAMLGNRTKVSQTVDVNLCGFYADMQYVTNATLAELRAYKNKC
jgi:Tissue inhibitor of metalloproteinase